MRRVAVIPAFEAARSVGAVIEGLLSAWPPEAGPPTVIVVDDGSTDDTAARAREAGAVVLRHTRNRGKGAALRTGLARALALGADAAVTVDADGQHPPAEGLRLMMDAAPASTLVLGIRDLVRDAAPRANRMSNAISNFFLSGFARRRLDDTQCGLRRYPLPQSLEIAARADGFAYEAEIALRAARVGWDIVQRPVRVVYPPEDERVSHFDVVRDPARIVARVLLTLATTPGPR